MTEKKKKKNKYRIVVVIFAAVLAIAVAAGILLNNKGEDTEKKVSAKPEEENIPKGDIVWNGKEYVYNEHLSNFLFLGIDNREKEATSTGQANAGQADALYLLSWDRVADSVTVISIPRDTMTEIEVFGVGGKSLGMTRDHISLSYAYGDGGHESCRLAEEAVSELLYGLPIQGYCSINLDGISALTKGVGEITVTVPNDSLESVDDAFQEGSKAVLNAENAELFVRYRDIEVSQSAISRMERQKEFIKAYGAAAQKKFGEDPDFVAETYNSLEPYMVTNMGSDQFVKIMESMQKEGTYSEWTIPGEGVEGKSYDEFEADHEALYEKIVETFYKEIQ